MGKTKSKTQKQKKNLKKKLKKQEEKKTNLLPSTDVITTKPKEEKKAKLTDRNKVKYNVALNNRNNVQKPTNDKKKGSSAKKPTKTNKIVKISKTEKKPKINKTKTIKQKINPPKKKQEIKSKNPIIRVFIFIKNNIHILFNAIYVAVFIAFVVGLVETKAAASIFWWIICITVFFGLLAISYNKYLSGKVFTLILCFCMIAAIKYLDKTYDFINNLNSKYYESETYYVVTFDNNMNRNIYSLSEKNIGLLSENHKNVESVLNVKINTANYHIYEDANSLFSDFHTGKVRGVIVTENGYKYLQNNIDHADFGVKVLYEFEANIRK